MKLQLTFLFCLALICQARQVEVVNYGRGPVVVACSNYWLELPAGIHEVQVEDGEYTLSNSNGVANITVGGDFGICHRITVGGNGTAIYVAQEDRHDLLWWFCTGMGFGIPIVGYGLARRMFQPLGAGHSEEL
jgi:hypothetical protein